MIAMALAAAAIASQPVSVLVDTKDGASILLTRHPAPGAPVVLIHGLSANRFTWDLEGRGLAHTLQGAGYDVWLLDLRGRLDSTPPAGAGRRWDLDDYGRYDVAAALGHVATQTEHEEVAVVGHSMGGMVMAIHHHWHGDRGLGPVVILGSPLQFSHPDPLVTSSARSMAVGAASESAPWAWAQEPLSFAPLSWMGSELSGVDLSRFHDDLR